MARRRLLLALWLTMAGTALADVVVIANRDNPVRTLSPAQVSDLYLGRLRQLPDGEPVIVLEYRHDSSLRERFFRLLNGMSLNQLNAYWARLHFSGQVLPPPTLADSREVLTAVRSKRSAIGYLDAAEVDDTVRVVLRLKEGQ